MIGLVALLVVGIDLIIAIQIIREFHVKMNWKTYAIGIIAITICGFIWSIDYILLNTIIMTVLLFAPCVKSQLIWKKNKRFLPTSFYDIFLGVMSLSSTAVLLMIWTLYLTYCQAKVSF